MPRFPSRHQLEHVRSLLKPISSELGPRDFERDVVENAVQKLVDQAYMDPLLRANLGLQGTVTFESHRNLGTTDDDSRWEQRLLRNYGQFPRPVAEQGERVIRRTSSVYTGSQPACTKSAILCSAMPSGVSICRAYGRELS